MDNTPSVRLDDGDDDVVIFMMMFIILYVIFTANEGNVEAENEALAD